MNPVDLLFRDADMRWLPIATIGLVVLIALTMLLKAYFARRVKRQSGVQGMQYQDLDKMTKKGLVSPEEQSRIRQAMARQMTQRERELSEAERDRMILTEVEVNPEAAKKFLSAEQLARARKQTGQDPSFAPKPPEQPWPPELAEPETPPARPEPPPFEEGLSDAMPWEAPATGPQEKAPPPKKPPKKPGQPQRPEPSMNMPRVVKARQEGAGQSDLDKLLAKGAISREEYDRLSKFLKDKQS